MPAIHVPLGFSQQVHRNKKEDKSLGYLLFLQGGCCWLGAVYSQLLVLGGCCSCWLCVAAVPARWVSCRALHGVASALVSLPLAILAALLKTVAIDCCLACLMLRCCGRHTARHVGLECAWL